MKKFILGALTAMLALASCMEEISAPEAHSHTIFAQIEEDSLTKTLMDADNNVIWKENDQIIAFLGTTIGKKYQLSPGFDGQTAGSFDEVSSGGGSLNAGTGLAHNIAYYPYSSSIFCKQGESAYNLSVVLPSEQAFAPESFGNGTFPMVAVSNNYDITFRNVCGGIKLQLVGTQSIASIKIEGKNEEKLSGEATVTAYPDATAPAITMSSSASTSATLHCGGVQLNEDTATEFIITLPPTAFTKGFTVTVTDTAGGEQIIETEKSNNVLRSSLLVMPVVTVKIDPPANHDFNPDKYIVYTDDSTYVPSGDSYWSMKPFFKCPVRTIREIELKFNMSSSSGNLFYCEKPYCNNGAYLDEEGLHLRYDNSGYNVTTNDHVITWEEMGVLPTDKITLNISLSRKTVTVNDNEISIPDIGAFTDIEYLFSSYYYDNDDGYAKSYGGVPAGSKLYYAKIWDGAGEIIYQGYAARGEYSDGTYQYAWKSVYADNVNYEFSRTNFKDFWVYSYSYDWKHFGGGIDTGDVFASSVSIDKSSISLSIGNSYTLSASIEPFYATYKTITWSSSDPSVASVDQNGTVTALSAGTTTITATAAGGASSSCQVKVFGTPDVLFDYIDEYGINHGKGVVIDDMVWAPVNCGYHTEDYPYGKLYQWGRRYGQGYSTNYDKDVPEIVGGPVSLEQGQSKKNKNVFFSSADSYSHWTSFNNSLWNAGTTEEPIKTANDPCPSGWRIPTHKELDALTKNDGNLFTDNQNGQSGMFFSGSQPYSETGPRLFLPKAGTRASDGRESSRGYDGYYWASTPLREDLGYLTYYYFYNTSYSGSLGLGGYSSISMSNAFSVRCIQNTAQPVDYFEPEIIDLSEESTANSYIVSDAGCYTFKPTKGNSSESVGSIANVEILWESFGTSESLSKGALIKSVRYENGIISFETADTFKEGNAVIAAKNASGTILWSWHIWMTDHPAKHSYYRNTGAMMDRNLGATSATPGEVGALGLLYQWGRKDPFLGSSSTTSSSTVRSTITWPSSVSTNASRGTIEYAIANPTTFITNSSNYYYDWYYTGSNTTKENTRWASSEKTKTIYDPCPPGWRVPDGGDTGVWAKAMNTIDYQWGYPYDNSNRGIDFSNEFGGDLSIWYPAAGYRDGYNTSLNDTGTKGCYWTASVNKGESACVFAFYQSGDIYPSTQSYFRSEGNSVRCTEDLGAISGSSSGSYSLRLNSTTYGWKKSTSITNPDSSVYDGVYESTNKGIHSSQSYMYIDINGYERFKFYVRSNAESSYDYVVVSDLDCTLNSSTTSGSNVKMTTSGKQNSNTSINGYTLVEFTGIDKGSHTITVMYRKDSSQNTNDDKGYILIPKVQ